MLATYRTAAAERQSQGIPPLPLTADQCRDVCALLMAPPAGETDFLVSLITDRVSPGVDPAAKVKAEWLGELAHGEKSCAERAAAGPGEGAQSFATSLRKWLCILRGCPT